MEPFKSYAHGTLIGNGLQNNHRSQKQVVAAGGELTMKTIAKFNDSDNLKEPKRDQYALHTSTQSSPLGIQFFLVFTHNLHSLYSGEG